MVAFILSNENGKFKLFRDPERKVSRPKFGLRPTICQPLIYNFKHWTKNQLSLVAV